jgi:hypothetical protein
VRIADAPKWHFHYRLGNNAPRLNPGAQLEWKISLRCDKGNNPYRAGRCAAAADEEIKGKLKSFCGRDEEGGKNLFSILASLGLSRVMVLWKCAATTVRA